jgi:multidrug efflux pump subunit AcrA (membrane-fusion protein)
MSKNHNQSTPGISDVNKIKAEQDSQLANQIKKESEKIKTLEEASSKVQPDKKGLSKRVSLIIFLLILLIPLPKQVGGEIEIDGTPAANQAFLRPSISGTVEEVFVKTGQKVKVGDKIAFLRNWELEEKKLEAQKQLNRLEQTIPSVKAQSRAALGETKRAQEYYIRQKAQSDYTNQELGKLKDGLPERIKATQKQYEQIKLQAESLRQKATLHKRLVNRGVYPPQSALQSEYEANAAEKQAESLAAQVAAEKNELKEKSLEKYPESLEALAQVESNSQRAKAAYQEINTTLSQINGFQQQIALYNDQLKQLDIKSPINGRVLTLKTDLLKGQNVNKGDTVVVIGDLSEVKIKLLLPEEALAFTKIGAKVKVRVKAVPEQVFYGKVAQIAPITSETGEQLFKKRIFELTIPVMNKDDLLKPGMTGYAEIQTNSWKSLISLAWDEVYKVFRLDRYIDHNPFATLLQGS